MANDPWFWDGEAWQQRFPRTPPPARAGACMASDALGVVTIVGGDDGTTVNDDTSTLIDSTRPVKVHELTLPAQPALDLIR